MGRNASTTLRGQADSSIGMEHWQEESNEKRRLFAERGEPQKALGSSICGLYAGQRFEGDVGPIGAVGIDGCLREATPGVGRLPTAHSAEDVPLLRLDFLVRRVKQMRDAANVAGTVRSVVGDQPLIGAPAIGRAPREGEIPGRADTRRRRLRCTTRRGLRQPSPRGSADRCRAPLLESAAGTVRRGERWQPARVD